VVLGLMAPITFVMALDRTALVVAAPTVQKEYGFSLVEMSLILTSFSWTYAAMQLPAGWLTQRLGPRRALAWANLFWSVLTLATPFAHSFAGFIGLRALLGAGQSADWPASVTALRRWFPRRERSKGNSILLGGLYLGPIAAGPATAFAIASFGWRAAFFFFGALGVVLGIAWWTLFRDSPAEHRLISPEEVAFIAADQEKDPPGAAHTPAWGAFRRGLGSLQFWAIGLQYFFLILMQSFFVTWLPVYLVNVRHMSLKAMGISQSLPWVALFGMVFVAGWIADAVLRRTGSVWLARVPAAIAGFLIGAAALIAASRAESTPVMMALLCISLGAVGLVQVSIWSSAQDLGQSATSLVSGWTNLWGNLSNFVGPVSMAFLVEHAGGWNATLPVVGLVGACGAALWLLVQPQQPLRGLAPE
jgi:ACS family glucarate transporter-like MFS transporter